MNRAEKQVLIDELRTEFGSSPHAVLLDFKGLSVNAATEFRRKVRQAGSRYRVVKNSLAVRAVMGTPLEGLGPKFEGTTAWLYRDRSGGPGQGARRLPEGHPALSVKGGSCRARRCSTRKG
jgi:large subunit ribosomal protein L10